MVHQTSHYRAVFEAVYGPPPHLCAFCGEWFFQWGRGSDGGTIHHRDGDHTNNDPANLAPAHMGCHVSHHLKGQVPYERTPEIRAKVSASLTGKTQSAETRAKRGESLRRAYAEGRRTAPPGRPKGTIQPKVQCPECPRMISVSNLTRHVRARHGVT